MGFPYREYQYLLQSAGSAFRLPFNAFRLELQQYFHFSIVMKLPAAYNFHTLKHFFHPIKTVQNTMRKDVYYLQLDKTERPAPEATRKASMLTMRCCSSSTSRMNLFKQIIYELKSIHGISANSPSTTTRPVQVVHRMSALPPLDVAVHLSIMETMTPLDFWISATCFAPLRVPISDLRL
jgi:hypothetical protein